jgi:hypothetical protein
MISYPLFCCSDVYFSLAHLNLNLSHAEALQQSSLLKLDALCLDLSSSYTPVRRQRDVSPFSSTGLVRYLFPLADNRIIIRQPQLKRDHVCEHRFTGVCL